MNLRIGEGVCLIVPGIDLADGKGTGLGASLDVCVVGGCGHVGLPLALVFARAGLQVGVYDTDDAKVASVAEGVMPFLEPGADDLLRSMLDQGRLEFSASPDIVRRAEAVVLVVGTPIDEFLNPSLRVFEHVLDDLSEHISDGALVILRSTVYPGATEWVATGLADRGRRVDVAFCPERIAEGKAIEELASLPQIVGGVTEAASARAEALFRQLHVSTIRTTPKEAELAKLFTNAWRYVKFAVANQFFIIATQAGVDYDRLLHAVRHQYPRATDLPGPGFAAGPCLLKDTMQLSAFDGNNFVLGNAARLVNEGLPDQLVRQLDVEIGLRDREVTVLGMAFKAGSDDIRASLSYKLKRLLWFAGARVACSDPYVSDPDLVPLDKAVRDAQIVIIGAPHAEYHGLQLDGKRLVDIWGIVDGRIHL